MSKKHRIAVIAGDGIGKEVMPEGIRVMEAAARKFGIDLQFDHFDFSSWDYFEKHGKMLPDDWKEQIGGHDAIYFGAVGWPEKIADHISLWGSLLLFRREFDQYINLRPARLMPGVTGPLATKAPIDFVVVREGTEGPYVGAGGVLAEGTDAEIATEESLNTRRGAERVIRDAFERALKRDRKKLTLVHKNNVLTRAGGLWTRTFNEVAKEYPTVTTDYLHVDAASMFFVTNPERFDVVVTDNLFGDILTDIAAAICGGIGLAASGNINPTRKFPSMFEPVHGSAPDIAGKNIADPTATVMSVAMMLDHLGYSDAARDIERAVASDLLTRANKKRSTTEIGDALVAAL
jgi:3-isopropylmalate dehydrogenase